MNKIDFEALSYIPKAGEGEAKTALEKLGWNVEVVAGNSNYWYKDIDLITTKDAIVMNVEIKWDKQIATTGNIFVESISNIEINRKGWFHYCEADFLFYGDAVNKLFYIIPLGILKEHIAQGCFKQATVNDYDSNGSIWKHSLGWLVPIDELVNKYNLQTILV